MVRSYLFHREVNHSMPKGQKKTKTATEIEAEKKVRRASFVKLSNHRVSAVIDGLARLHPLANKKSYEFAEADILKIKAAIQKELDAAITKLETASKATAAAPAKAFSLE